MSRMKTVRASLAGNSSPRTDQTGPMLRFIGVSATIPNIEDVRLINISLHSNTKQLF